MILDLVNYIKKKASTAMEYLSNHGADMINNMEDGFTKWNDRREEELEHRDTGLGHGAKQAPGYEVLTGAIKAGSKLAIWLSKRI